MLFTVLPRKHTVFQEAGFQSTGKERQTSSDSFQDAIH